MSRFTGPSTDPVSVRVERGMATLSTEQIDRIDIYRIDIANPWNCVIGQLFGSYYNDAAYRFLNEVRGPALYPWDYGFDGWDSIDNAELNEEWVRQIQADRDTRRALVPA